MDWTPVQELEGCCKNRHLLSFWSGKIIIWSGESGGLLKLFLCVNPVDTRHCLIEWVSACNDQMDGLAFLLVPGHFTLRLVRNVG